LRWSNFIFQALLLVISLVNGESEEETPSKEDNDKRIEDEIRFHANPGQQTRKDLKNVAGMMLEEVGLPFFSWPTYLFLNYHLLKAALKFFL